jgi:hypothetical protein
MPDIALFTAALTSLKTATEIAKTLRDNDLAVEKSGGCRREGECRTLSQPKS